MKLFNIVQTAIAIALMAVILLQNRGAGLGGVFGGNSGTVFSAKRGLEKILFKATIVLAIAFVGLSFINIIW